MKKVNISWSRWSPGTWNY